MRLLTRLLILFVLAFIGCSSQSIPMSESNSAGRSESASDSAGDSAAGAIPQRLGTAWGERVESNLNYVSFYRDDERRPDSLATIHYDDRRGRKQSKYHRKHSKGFTMLDGEIEFGLTDEEALWSPFLPGIEHNGEYYVQGKNGDRYAIFVRNRSDSRVEVVLSVDGLDVINGRDASFEHRGYIIDPGERLIVEGFRTSRSSVAAFRFSDAQDSYASEKTGSVKNVGVVGLAVFTEEGSRRYANRARERSGANPFPGKFATRPSR